MGIRFVGSPLMTGVQRAGDSVRQARSRVLSEPVIYSRRHPGEVQAAVIRIQQTWTLRLREAGPRALAHTPSSVVQTRLIRAWTLNRGAVQPAFLQRLSCPSQRP